VNLQLGSRGFFSQSEERGMTP